MPHSSCIVPDIDVNAMNCRKNKSQHLSSNGSLVLCCEMHVSHACQMHEPSTDAGMWTCGVWWAAHIG